STDGTMDGERGEGGDGWLGAEPRVQAARIATATVPAKIGEISVRLGPFPRRSVLMGRQSRSEVPLRRRRSTQTEGDEGLIPAGQFKQGEPRRRPERERHFRSGCHRTTI